MSASEGCCEWKTLSCFIPAKWIFRRPVRSYNRYTRTPLATIIAVLLILLQILAGCWGIYSSVMTFQGLNSIELSPCGLLSSATSPVCCENCDDTLSPGECDFCFDGDWAHAECCPQPELFVADSLTKIRIELGLAAIQLVLTFAAAGLQLREIITRSIFIHTLVGDFKKRQQNCPNCFSWLAESVCILKNFVCQIHQLRIKQENDENKQESDGTPILAKQNTDSPIVDGSLQAKDHWEFWKESCHCSCIPGDGSSVLEQLSEARDSAAHSARNRRYRWALLAVTTFLCVLQMASFGYFLYLLATSTSVDLSCLACSLVNELQNFNIEAKSQFLSQAAQTGALTVGPAIVNNLVVDVTNDVPFYDPIEPLKPPDLPLIAKFVPPPHHLIPTRIFKDKGGNTRLEVTLSPTADIVSPPNKPEPPPESPDMPEDPPEPDTPIFEENFGFPEPESAESDKPESPYISVEPKTLTRLKKQEARPALPKEGYFSLSDKPKDEHLPSENNLPSPVTGKIRSKDEGFGLLRRELFEPGPHNEKVAMSLGSQASIGSFFSYLKDQYKDEWFFCEVSDAQRTPQEWLRSRRGIFEALYNKSELVASRDEFTRQREMQLKNKGAAGLRPHSLHWPPLQGNDEFFENYDDARKIVRKIEILDEHIDNWLTDIQLPLFFESLQKKRA